MLFLLLLLLLLLWSFLILFSFFFSFLSFFSFSMTRIGPTTDTWPLFEIVVSQPSVHVHRIHLSISLFLVDGMTEQILRSEVADIASMTSDPTSNRNNPLPELGLTFRDYSTSVQNIRAHPTFESSLQYWRSRIPTLPTAPSVPTRVSPTLVSLVSSTTVDVSLHSSGDRSWRRSRMPCLELV